MTADPAVAHELNRLGLGTVFDHVAHAVRRIHDVLPLYRDVLGGEFVHGAEHDEIGYRAVHVRFADGSKIELLEPLDGSTFFDRFFDRNPTGGLHHVTFRVPDLATAVDAMRRAGFEVFGVSRARPEWQEAFLHPRVAYGTLLQLAEVAPGFPPRMTAHEVEAMLAAAGDRRTRG